MQDNQKKVLQHKGPRTTEQSNGHYILAQEETQPHKSGVLVEKQNNFYHPSYPTLSETTKDQQVIQSQENTHGK